MATYAIVPRHIPSAQRTTLISDVAVGDKINVEEILGRPARGMILEMTSDTDVASYRLNNLIKNTKVVNGLPTQVEFWSASDSFPVYTNTGSTTHETIDGFEISSVEVTALTLSTGTTITITVW